jgi:HSP20 family protein
MSRLKNKTLRGGMAMKKKLLLALTPLLLICGIAFLVPAISSFAEENVEDLKKQIEELRAEVADLKAAQNPQEALPRENSLGFWPQASSSFWDPFAEMQQMQDRMNRIFRESFRRSNSLLDPSAGQFTSFYEPDLDIQDQKDHYLITLDLPGIDKDKINIEATEHDIVISGERNYQSESQDDQKGFYRMERRFGSFSRRLPLPEDANPDGVEAQYKEGVLEIKVPKKESTAPKEESKRIKIS